MFLKLIDAAHTISFHLHELLDETQANAIRDELDSLLQKASMGENVRPQLHHLLNRYEMTQKWVDEFLNPTQSPNKEFKVPPGRETPIGGMRRYICPKKDCCRYWYQQQVGQTIPKCFQHQETLIPEPTQEGKSL